MPSQRNKRHRRDAMMGGLMTLGFMLLVAVAAGDQGWVFSASAFLVAILAVGGLYLLFPHGPLFALGVANGLAVYMCLFVVIGRSAFPGVNKWALPIGFLMPVAAFVITCWLQREKLVPAASEGLSEADLAHLPRFLRWLALCALVGVLVLASPFNRSSPEIQTAMLLISMALIAAISVISVQDVVRLLVDVAAILTLVSTRLKFLAVPIATYVSLFALVTVIFGCFYRIADGMSRRALFEILGRQEPINFSEALHFSVVTLATVGYGDIHPIDDGIRILAALEIVIGQILLLFGFSEIMRGKIRGRAD